MLLPGVHDVVVRPHTGSVLVLFDPELEVAAIERQLMAALARGARPHKAKRRSADEALPPHARAITDVVLHLKTDPANGLSREEADRRLETVGPNTLRRQKPRPAWAIALEQISSLPTALLGGSAIVSAATGGAADAAVTLAVAGANAAIGYATESQAEATLRAFAAPASHSAAVIRSGQTTVLGADAVVPGDVLILTPGAFVAADGRVVESAQLSADEALLTGESNPVPKDTAPLDPDTPLADRANMVFMGTSVTGGSGRAVVVATGPETEIGRIQALAGDAERPTTPVERELEALGRNLVYLALGVCALTFGLGVLRGYPRLAMMKNAIALAVAAIPEGLPTVATTTLALGLKRMERRNVLIRRLDAVEALGALQVVCFDKTGTLTENAMTARRLFVAGRSIDVGPGAGPHTRERLGDGPLEEMLRVACLCNEAAMVHDAAGDHMVGSSTEAALVVLAAEYGIDVDALRDGHRVRQTVYRDLSHPRMATWHARPGRPDLLAVKGRPDHVLALCKDEMREGEIRPLTDDCRQQILDENAAMTADGLRVLGFAMREAGPDGAPERELTWLGLAGLSDPVRGTAGELLRQFHDAGIRTVMITGDQPGTAAAVARELRLAGDRAPKVLNGADIDRMSADEMAEAACDADVFARVSPAHKLRIVRALQTSGLVVGMTGDGVNDGPALKAADIGIAMGRSGSDAARDIANVVLSDDNLETLVDAIGQGRTIYGNIRKALRFLLTTNMSEIFVTLAEILHGPNELETPLELLWINLVTDVLPGLGLAMSPLDPGVMDAPPRPSGAPILSPDDFREMAIDGSTIGVSVLTAHLAALAKYGVGPQTRAVTFSSLVFSQLLYAYACRSGPETQSPIPLFGSGPLNASVAASAALQALPLFVPPVQRLLGIAPLSWSDVPLVAGASLAPFLLKEFRRSRRP